MTQARAIHHYTFEESRRRMAAGSEWLPGGASSDYRLGPTALVFDRADGAEIWDIDGNRLIDYYLGAGPIIVHRDTGIIYDRTLSQYLLTLARANGLPAQDGLFAGYGSDGLALAESGSPTALVTVATRYTHTAFETIHPEDLASTAALLRLLVTNPLPVRRA